MPPVQLHLHPHSPQFGASSRRYEAPALRNDIAHTRCSCLQPSSPLRRTRSRCRAGSLSLPSCARSRSLPAILRLACCVRAFSQRLASTTRSPAACSRCGQRSPAPLACSWRSTWKTRRWCPSQWSPLRWRWLTSSSSSLCSGPCSFAPPSARSSSQVRTASSTLYQSRRPAQHALC